MEYIYGKNIIITGGSSGIGKACAELFASKGYNVFSLALEKSGIQNKKIKEIICDVRSDISVKDAYEKIVAVTKDIGIILNCAGFGITGAAEDTNIDEIKGQFDTNYFGVVRINKQFMPLLRNRKSGLVIVIGSVAGLISIPFQSHYSSGKYALEAYVEALRIESRSFGIKACIIEPGDTKTNFPNSRFKSLKYYDESPYGEKCKKSILKMEYDEKHGKAPITVAKAALKVTNNPHPPVRKVVGLSYKIFVFLKRIVPSKVVEFFVSKLYC